MSSRKRGRKPKQQQQQLTFEAVHDANAPTASGTGSTLPGGGLSPAKVRFASPGGVGTTGSPVQRGGGIALRSSTARPSTLGRMSTPSRKPTKRQQTLDVSMGRDEVKKVAKKQAAKKQAPAETDVDDELTPDKNNSATETRRQAVPTPPRSSFMKATRGSRRAIVVDSDSETPVEVDGAISDSDGEGPLKQETPRAIQTKHATSTPDDGDSSRSSSSDEDADDGENEDEDADNTRSSQSLPNHAAAEDDSDDEPLVTPRSSMPRRKGRQVITLDDDDDDDDGGENEEQEDEDVQTPAKRRRVTKTRTTLIRSGSVSSETDTAPAKSRGKAASKERGSPPPASTARNTRSAVRKGHRTEKEKRMELLRRRRAGEKDLTMEDLATSEDEDDGALYDTDEEYQALDVFDDESEHEEEAPAKKKSKKKSKEKAKKPQSARQSSVLDDQDANSEDENFIDDEDDTMGVPDEALHLIPIEFTRASRKPLKDHFKDAVEWLVHRKINPGFDRDNEVYVTAWRRLSDEVTGLANSKFISSVWRPDFHKALKARPYIEQQEIGAGHLGTEFESCQACGRSGHPATWSIQFKGKPYDPKSLDEVESDSEDEDDVDRDYDGSLIPPEDKEFLVGQTCNANAETAHSLTHWRPSLRDWVDARLEAEGWMEAGRIVEREKMKPRRRERLADQIVERWHDGDIVKNLFMDFKRTIESAREKDTTKVRRGGGRY